MTGSRTETAKLEALAEQGVDVLRRLSTSKVSLSDAALIAGWVTEARVALRALSPAHGEAVAWQIMLPGGHEGAIHRIEAEAEAVSTGFKTAFVRPLWTHPASIEVTEDNHGVRVAPLEWVKSNVVDRWTAATPWGELEVIYASFADGRGDPLSFGWFSRGEFLWTATLEEAKAAAQSDFEHRILSSLSPPTGG